jgi:hypothetical protein
MPALMDDKFAREAVPLCGGVVLLSMCDCTLLQFLPWKQSPMFTESKGFPALSMLRWCMCTKVIQSTVSVVCQLIFITTTTTAADIMTPQAKALFGMNITLAIMGVVTGLVLLSIKSGLLSRMIEGDKGVAAAAVDHELGRADNNKNKEGLVFSHTDIYSSREVALTVNPMLYGSNRSGCGDRANSQNISTNQEFDEVSELRSENENLRNENKRISRDMQSQISTLERKNSTLREEISAFQSASGII